MNQRHKQTLIGAALAALLTLRGSVVSADSLVTTDGDMLSGVVTKTATGYTVQTADGPIQVQADRVKRVLYDHAPGGAAPNPVAPSTPVAPPVTPPVPPPAIPSTISPVTPSIGKVKDPAMLKALIGQGEVAYAANQYTDARDSFTDALALDPKSPVAGRGLGYAYIKLNKISKSVRPLELAAAAGPLDRSLTMGLSAGLLATHNSMRAVKLLKAYLEAHPTPVDEPMVDAFGIALSQVDRASTRGSLFADSAKLYAKLNSQLEEAQPGKRRWGTTWLDEADFKKKQKARDKASKKADDAMSKLQAANGQLQSANDALATVGLQSRRAGDNSVQRAQSRANKAKGQQQSAQSDYDSAAKELSDTPAPEYQDAISLDGVDFSLSQPVIASAQSFPAPSAPANSTPASDGSANTPNPPNSSPKSTGQPKSTSSGKKPLEIKPDPPTSTPRGSESESTSPAATETKPEVHLTRYAVAFAVAPDVVVTAGSTVEGASSIHITLADGKSLGAHVLRVGSGLALLKVDNAKLPCVALATSAAGAGSMSCLSYPEVDFFNPLAKSMPVTSADQTTLQGNDNWTVRFEASPRIPGGPLLKAGAVVGVELGDRDSDLAEVPAVTLKQLSDLTGSDAVASPAATDPKLAVVQVSAER